ncbi:MAG: hypothetical protein K9L22_09275 [Methylococcaceae bacterium]|nr:hypothetical protein [Methylococcaceae bacterium]
MQGFFRQWAEIDLSSAEKSDIFINYSQIEFLQQLNKDLLVEQDDQALQQQLVQNINLIRALAGEIVAEACAGFPELKAYVPEISVSSSRYLGGVFELLNRKQVQSIGNIASE